MSYNLIACSNVMWKTEKVFALYCRVLNSIDDWFCITAHMASVKLSLIARKLLDTKNLKEGESQLTF